MVLLVGCEICVVVVARNSVRAGRRGVMDALAEALR